MMHTIRAINKNDLSEIKNIIDSNQLFPSEMLDDMVLDFFNDPGTRDIWLAYIIDDKPVSVAYCAPERMTEGTYNLYLIAVHSELKGKGIGGKFMEHIEKLLQSQGVRVLLGETSGLPEFELTRRFYDKCRYNREAVIRDFYRDGEDKVVFRKKLN